MSSNRRSPRSPSSSESNNKSGLRLARLNQVLFEELSALVSDELRDPLLAHVRLRALELSVDARMARVHFLLLGPDVPSRREEVERALARASPFLRSRLAELVELKRVPELRFVFQGFAAADPQEES